MISSSKFVSENLIPSEVRHQFDCVPGAKQKVVEKGELFYFRIELDSKTYPPLASYRLQELVHLKFPHAHTNRNGKIEWEKMSVLPLTRKEFDPDFIKFLKATIPTKATVPQKKVVIEKILHRHSIVVTGYNGELWGHERESFKLPRSYNKKKSNTSSVEEHQTTTSSRVSTRIASSSLDDGSVKSASGSVKSNAGSVKSTADSVRSSRVAGSMTSSKRL